MQCGHAGEDIVALLDDELSPARRQEVEARIAGCATCRQEYQSYARNRIMLRATPLSFETPDELKARIREAIAGGAPLRVRTARVTTVRSWPGLLAAGLLIAAASSALTFAGVERQHRMPAAESEVVASHVRAMTNGHVTEVASNNQHNVKPWFAGKVDVSPAVPRLDSAGFVLTGGRVDSVGGRVAAVVTYTRRLHVIDVYSTSTTDAASTPPRETTINGYNVISWRAAGVEQRAVSDLNLTELRDFVSAIMTAR